MTDDINQSRSVLFPLCVQNNFKTCTLVRKKKKINNNDKGKREKLFNGNTRKMKGDDSPLRK